MTDLPFQAEYAKSGRASCKGCKQKIDQGTLRIAIMVQSAFFDGKQPNWHHEECFFKKARAQTIADIANFNKLKNPDKERIKKMIESNTGIAMPVEKGKGKKGKRAAENGGVNLALKDFAVEYAKSSRATCAHCEIKICKDEVRICKILFDTEVGMKYGGQPIWHHVQCFEAARDNLGYMAGGEDLPGYNNLTKEDQKMVKEAIKPKSVDNLPIKKLKTEPKDEADIKKEKDHEKLLAKQNKLFHKYRSALSEYKKSDLHELMEANNMEIPQGGADVCLDRLADCMAFGVPDPCPECKGQLVLDTFNYKCIGNISEWTKCSYTCTEPKKTKFKVPKAFKDSSAFHKYKPSVAVRAFDAAPPPPLIIKKEEPAEKKNIPIPPLKNLQFFIYGKLQSNKEDVKHRILKLGGLVVSKLTDTTAAVVSTKKDVEKMGTKMSEIQEADIEVVEESFFDLIDPATGTVAKTLELIKMNNIADWGSDPVKRVPQDVIDGKSIPKSGSMYVKSGKSGTTKLKIKGGTAVDPDSGLEDVAHVYRDEEDGAKYTVVLCKTDVVTQKNSYYKLQVLEADNKKKYWLFRSWGRIGTTIGGSKTEECKSVHDALNKFGNLYMEKTDNPWECREYFEKVPGGYYPIEVDYGDDTDGKRSKLQVDKNCKLPEPVQKLVVKIFDIDVMKKTLLEFELDTEKMPLGKLSKKQIKAGYKVLTELLNYIEQGKASENKIKDATNSYQQVRLHLRVRQAVHQQVRLHLRVRQAVHQQVRLHLRVRQAVHQQVRLHLRVRQAVHQQVRLHLRVRQAVHQQVRLHLRVRQAVYQQVRLHLRVRQVVYQQVRLHLRVRQAVHQQVRLHLRVRQAVHQQVRLHLRVRQAVHQQVRLHLRVRQAVYQQVRLHLRVRQVVYQQVRLHLRVRQAVHQQVRLHLRVRQAVHQQVRLHLRVRQAEEADQGLHLRVRQAVHQQVRLHLRVRQAEEADQGLHLRVRQAVHKQVRLHLRVRQAVYQQVRLHLRVRQAVYQQVRLHLRVRQAVHQQVRLHLRVRQAVHQQVRLHLRVRQAVHQQVRLHLRVRQAVYQQVRLHLRVRQVVYQQVRLHLRVRQAVHQQVRLHLRVRQAVHQQVRLHLRVRQAVHQQVRLHLRVRQAVYQQVRLHLRVRQVVYQQVRLHLRVRQAVHQQVRLHLRVRQAVHQQVRLHLRVRQAVHQQVRLHLRVRQAEEADQGLHLRVRQAVHQQVRLHLRVRQAEEADQGLHLRVRQAVHQQVRLHLRVRQAVYQQVRLHLRVRQAVYQQVRLHLRVRQAVHQQVRLHLRVRQAVYQQVRLHLRVRQAVPTGEVTSEGEASCPPTGEVTSEGEASYQQVRLHLRVRQAVHQQVRLHLRVRQAVHQQVRLHLRVRQAVYQQVRLHLRVRQAVHQQVRLHLRVRQAVQQVRLHLRVRQAVQQVRLHLRVRQAQEADQGLHLRVRQAVQQIKAGYKVLTELLNYIEQGKASENKIKDATNRFFSMVPHDFGVNNAPLLDSVESIKKKTEMLDNLLEIEIAYSLLKTDSDDETSPIEQHYTKLKANIAPLDKTGEEFKMILEYVTNTHAATHSGYTLEVEEVFKVVREGEDKRYKPFKKLHNRRLLWHGSRVTNFAGILSQGLRIAPPEAPVTGYMFGKGVYFADMVSKSANYCCTSKANPTGIMLLCEVALGDMKQCHRAEMITKLPPGLHSAWGVGRTQPNPEQARTLPDGTLVPLGKPVTNYSLDTSLLYNEFIVYDVAQVNVKYLLQMKFNHKY
ncbi:poly(ADP-ribose) polymerase catalytic domain-containing protein [Phthorimaea operculella]|nr:poly(ADP-ribose) polymerase catalytic domain-containing protein [Phthorimaea operculella]